MQNQKERNMGMEINAHPQTMSKWIHFHRIDTFLGHRQKFTHLVAQISLCDVSLKCLNPIAVVELRILN